MEAAEERVCQTASGQEDYLVAKVSPYNTFIYYYYIKVVYV